jgi:glycosyltransferase involved in cell wall biosynthesis
VPLLSVIIPTHRRPHLLQRAIDSALQSAPEGDAEVLVIPNGLDESWKFAAANYALDRRVKWHHIAINHPSAARNRGLELATGKFIRFLDDDDYLFGEARLQCELFDGTDLDVSQGGIDRVDMQGALLEEFLPLASVDFLLSILSGRIFTLCHSFLWRRDWIKGHQWNSNLVANEDVAWALGLARDKEVSMHCHAQTVGAWVNHSRNSTSQRAGQLVHDRSKVEILLNLAHGLEGRSAFSDARRMLIGTNLWNCIHNSFPIDPAYWTRIAIRTMRIAPGSKPDIQEFNTLPFSLIHPLVMEFLITPHRFIRHRLRTRSMP